MQTISDRIRELRKERGLTQKALAQKVGVSQGSVAHWERDANKLNAANMQALAQALKTSSQYILSGKPDQEPLGSPVDEWDDNTPLGEDDYEVPYLLDLEAAAGVGKLVDYANNTARIRLSKSTLKKCGVERESAVCLRVKGDSMEPVLPDGTTIGVDTGNTTIVDGKLYLVQHGNLLRAKALYKLPNQGVRLRSYNTAEYPDEILTAQDIEHEDFVVKGRIFWYSVLL